MKKFFVVCALVISVCFIAEAAPPIPPGTTVRGAYVTPVGNKAFKLPQYTVATLPTFTASDAGARVEVTDGATTEDCITGSGSEIVTCRWSGSAWANSGDGGATEIEAGAFDFTTWNANTNGATKDAIRDQFVVYDTDGDGDIDNVDGAVGGGDITGVGPAGLSAGDALTDGYATSGATLFIFEGTTVDTNEYIINMPAADPAADITWTFPGNTGTGLVGAGAGYSDNILLKVDGAASHLTQATGITVDDSNNITGVGTISSGAITSTGTSTFADAISPDSADSATIGSATAEWSDLYLADGGVIYGQNDQSNSITSSATGWTFALDAVIGGSDLSLGTAGVKLTGDGDGAITLLGMGDGFDEDLTINLDDTSNTAVVSSSTGVTLLSLTSIGITTGAANNFSAGTTTLGTVAGTITDGTASWNAATQALSGFATVAATTSVTSPLYDVSGAAAITVGSADVTAITLQTDDTGDGTDLVLPAQSVNGSEMLNNTVTATQLAAALTMADGDLIDLSGITHTVATDEGFVLPNWANVVPTSDKKFLAADGSNLKLYNGGWVTIGASAAPTDATYLTLSLDATLSAERVLTAGYALDFTDAGANGNLTIALDTTEVSADGSDTWSDNSQASVAWTINTSGVADNVITFTDGLTTFNDAVTVTDTLTTLAGINLGTSQALIGTTAMTIGNNAQTIAINSSDWDIDATGIMTGIGNITSDGVVTATGFTIGAAAITETELEILDGATLSTTQINYLNAATGTTGTTSTNLVFSASPTIDSLTITTALTATDLIDSAHYVADSIDNEHINWADIDNLDDEGMPIDFALTAEATVADDIAIRFGGAATDWYAEFDDSVDDQMLWHTTATAAIATTDPMFEILVDFGTANGTGMTADQQVFGVAKGTQASNVSLFSIDEDGDVVIAGSLTSSGSGESYISLANNSGGRSPGVGEYGLYFETDTTDQLKYAINGSEKSIMNLGDAQTATAVKTFEAGAYIGDADTAGVFRIYDGTGQYYTIATGNQTASFTLTMPDGGSINKYLYDTDGAGTLGWGTPSAAASTDGGEGGVQYNTGGALDADASFNFAEATYTLTIGESNISSLDGKVVLFNEGGTDYTVTIQPGTQSGNAVITLPGATATLATLGNAETFSGAKGFSSAPFSSVANTTALVTDAGEWADLLIGDGGVVYLGNDQDVLITHVADTGINITTTAATSGVFNLGNDDDVNDDSIDLILHDSGVITLYDANDDTSVTLSVGDGTTVLSVAGGLSATGNVEGATLTEGGQAVYNASETPGGELGGTWASPTIDDTGIALTSITIGALLGVDSIDATGAVDMDYGSADVTDHTFTTDGGTVVLDGSIVASAGIESSGLYDVTGAVGLDLGSADVTDITLLGQAEDLAITPSADKWTLTSSTGVTSIDIVGISLTDDGVAYLTAAANTIDSDQYVDGSIDLIHLSTDSVDYTKTTGSFKSLTPVNDSAANFAANFTGANLYGGTFLCSTTGTIQLPAVAAGMNFTIITVGAIAVSADTNASDLMMLDGVALDDGDKATNTSTAGDIIVFQYMDATGWVATSNGWTDGGP